MTGFNDVDLKPGAQQHLTISGRPLLVTGRFGQGNTVAFTGFTPAYADVKSFWDPKVILPYAVDQEFATNPVSKAYFGLYMRMIAAALGESPATNFDELLAAKDKPLFEGLQDLPGATLGLPAALSVESSGKKASVSLPVTNGPKFARLVRVRAEWPSEAQGDWIKYSDNYFDLLPGEKKNLELEFFLPKHNAKNASGTLIVEGPNIETKRIPFDFKVQ